MKFWMTKKMTRVKTSVSTTSIRHPRFPLRSTIGEYRVGERVPPVRVGGDAVRDAACMSQPGRATHAHRPAAGLTRVRGDAYTPAADAAAPECSEPPAVNAHRGEGLHAAPCPGRST